MENASPEMVPPTDVSLDDRVANKRRHEYLYPKRTEILINEYRNLFYKVGTDKDGWFVGYDKKVELIYYLVKFEQISTFLGKAVTQTQIWRWDTNALAQGTTETVVFDILIKKFGSIVSDSHHTPDGKKFWKILLARAERRNLYFGLLNLKTKEVFSAGKGEVVSHFLDRVAKKAWGDTENFQDMRFIISKNPI